MANQDLVNAIAFQNTPKVKNNFYTAIVDAISSGPAKEGEGPGNIYEAFGYKRKPPAPAGEVIPDKKPTSSITPFTQQEFNDSILEAIQAGSPESILDLVKRQPKP